MGFGCRSLSRTHTYHLRTSPESTPFLPSPTQHLNLSYNVRWCLHICFDLFSYVKLFTNKQRKYLCIFTVWDTTHTQHVSIKTSNIKLSTESTHHLLTLVILINVSLSVDRPSDPPGRTPGNGTGSCTPSPCLLSLRLEWKEAPLPTSLNVRKIYL